MVKIAQKISAFNRERKWIYFKNSIYFNENTKILDVGFADIEFSEIDNYLEKKYPFQQNITALGINGKENFQKKYPLVNAVLYDGKIFPFEDKVFDICWSNAVIEHVGNFDDQVLFINETRRVAKTIILTTPNKHFPIEVHTRTPVMHFLPKPLFDKYLNFIGKKWATGIYMNLLTKRNIKDLLVKAKIDNYTITGNKLLGFTLDFVIIIRS